MRYWGMDFLKCIYCGSFPLRIIPLSWFKQEEVDVSSFQTPVCKHYCSYRDEEVKQGKEYPCFDCLKIEIDEAVLFCKQCSRWYPVKKGIVQILKDSKRSKERDLEFLNKWKDKLPKEVLYNSKPYGLS